MKYPNHAPYHIPSIAESLAEKVKSGKLSLYEAAVELALAGFNFNIVSEDFAREFLGL